jgi:dCMP deaminase
MILKWHKRMLELTEYISSWSKDPDRQVGAVITNPQNRILSTGYNGYPFDIVNNIDEKAEKLFKTVHAEVNAILMAPQVQGMTIFINHHPCAQCAAMIRQAGFAAVICPPPEQYSSWAESMAVAEDLIKPISTYYDRWQFTDKPSEDCPF